MWTILLSKAYVVMWSFGKRHPHAMSTWLMNAPLRGRADGFTISL